MLTWILLLCIGIFVHRSLFWIFVYQTKEFRFDRIGDYLKLPEARKVFGSKVQLLDVGTTLLVFVGVIWNSQESIVIWGIVLLASLIHIGFCGVKLYHHRQLIPKFSKRVALITMLDWGVFLLLIGLLKGQLELQILVAYLSIIWQPLILLSYILFTLPLVWANRKTKILNASTLIREYKNITSIGIAGSYGKTSIKHYLGHLISDHTPVIITPQNTNTEIGVSEFILSEPFRSFAQAQSEKSEKKIFIAEMGEYILGDVALLGEIVDHTHGFITGINGQHMSLFGSQENIIKGILEIEKNITKHHGVLYVNQDSQFIAEIKFPGTNIVRYGFASGADACLWNVQNDGLNWSFDLYFRNEVHHFHLQAIWRHVLTNLAGCIACALDQGISAWDIQTKLQSLPQIEGTLMVKQDGEATILDDTYNLNYDGLMAACEVLSSWPSKYRCLVLDDILELGDATYDIHQQIGVYLASKNFDALYLVGKNFASIVQEHYLKSGGRSEAIKSIFTTPIGKTPGTYLLEGRESKKYLPYA